MGDSQRLRVVIASGSNEWSGMVAQHICREGVELAGVILEGPPPRKKKSAGGAGRLKTAWMHAFLAMKFPRWYFEKIMRAIGHCNFSAYQQLRRNRGEPQRVLSKWVGGEYAALASGVEGFPTLEEVAQAAGVAMIRVQSINAEESAAFLRDALPDVLVALGTRIIKPPILSIPRLGALNAHASLLPDYRGGTTEFWQLVHGERQTGVTVHWMKEGVDEGNIVAQDRWPIRPGANHLQLRLVSQFGQLATWQRAFRLIQDGFRGTPQSQPAKGPFRSPTLEQVYAYYRRRPAAG